MASSSKEPATHLSKKLLGMKFMQRKQESELRSQLEKEQQRIIDEARWVLPEAEALAPAAALDVEVVQSYLDVVETSNGRQSFKAFNLDVEKQAKEHEKRRRNGQGASQSTEEEEEISAVEMAQRLSASQGERKRKSFGDDHGRKTYRLASQAIPAARQFLRPSDD